MDYKSLQLNVDRDAGVTADALLQPSEFKWDMNSMHDWNSTLKCSLSESYEWCR